MISLNGDTAHSKRISKIGLSCVAQREMLETPMEPCIIWNLGRFSAAETGHPTRLLQGRLLEQGGGVRRPLQGAQVPAAHAHKWYDALHVDFLSNALAATYLVCAHLGVCKVGSRAQIPQNFTVAAHYLACRMEKQHPGYTAAARGSSYDWAHLNAPNVFYESFHPSTR